MKKFAITNSTVSTMLENAELRSASDFVRTAYEKLNTETKTSGCSQCAKRKKINDVVNELITNLRNASDMEIDRIKKVLGVEKLVFGNGLSFIER